MVKKKQKQVVVGILFIVLLGFILSSNGLLPFAVSLDSNLGQCSGGFTTLSVSDVQINEVNNRIRVTGIAKGSECLSIQLRQSELSQKLENLGFEATRDVVGEVRLEEFTKTFPIDKTGRTYEAVGNNLLIDNSKTVGTFSSSQTRFTDYCRNEVGLADTIFGYKPTIFHNVRCVLPEDNGLVGSFSSARSFSDFSVRFSIGGRSTTLSRSDTSGSIGNHRIEWVGNLQNLDIVSVPQFDARLIGSQWELVDDGALNSINSRIDNFKNCMDYDSSDSNFDSCKTIFIRDTSSTLNNKLETYKNNLATLIYDADTDSNNLKVSLKATPFPAFILDLDAEDVGIIALEGNPDITECIPSNLDLSSGQNRQLTFRVKNDANTNNVEFNPSITCNRAVTAFVPNFQINANQEKTITAEIIPSNPSESDLSFNCQLRVRDVKSGNEDSCGFNGDVEFVSGVTCSPNTLTCDNNFRNVLQCDSSGESKSIKQTCEFGCKLSSSGAECKSDIDDTEEGFFSRLSNSISTFFKDLFSGVVGFAKLVKYAVVGLTSLFSYLVLIDELKRVKALNRNKVARFLVSGIVSGVIGLILFQFIGSFLFWIISILGLVVLIFWKKIKVLLL